MLSILISNADLTSDHDGGNRDSHVTDFVHKWTDRSIIDKIPDVTQLSHLCIAQGSYNSTLLTTSYQRRCVSYLNVVKLNF